MHCSLVSSELRTQSGIRPSTSPHPSAELGWWCMALLVLIALWSTPRVFANPSEPVSLERAAQPKWTNSAHLRNQAREALDVLREAPAHGLPANRYALSQLTSLANDLTSPDNERLFNELLTAALETYTVDLVQGLQPSAFKDRRDPKHRRNSPHTVSSQLQAGVLKGLHRSITTNRLGKFMRSIEPAHADYKVLQDALADYKALVAQGGWPQVPRSKDGAALRVGASHPRVIDLRSRLAVTDNSVKLTTTDPELYDDALEQAVIEFQIRHGLKGDGVVGKNTRAALNVSAADRLQQIELNLDRWRLMPNVMPANHIWVNVPEYEMKLQLDRQEVLGMRVVVGKTHWPTPMMEDRLEHVVFSPYWYPPQKIAIREILPAVKADPGYLDKRRFDVLEDNQPIDPSSINWADITPGNLTYRFRQRPGKGNSLGDVKFMFPNNYAVYMHDTNAKSLFDKSMRALSHGCIRLEDPESLASALLAWDRGWKRQKVTRAMASGRQKYVKLEQTVPVYLVYFTATVSDGALQFHNDLYGHDKRHTIERRAQQQQDKQGNPRIAQILMRYQKSNAVLPTGPTTVSVSQQQTPSGVAQPTGTAIASTTVP